MTLEGLCVILKENERGEKMEKKHERPEGLAPCPFCGSIDLILAEEGPSKGYWFICCQDCFCWGPQRIEKEEAIEKWNERY